MDALDQLLSAQAGSGAPPAAGNAAPGADPLDALLSARASTPAQPPAAPTPQAPLSTWDQFGRQLGLTARAGINGITAIPQVVGDAANAAYDLGIAGPVNSLTGKNTLPKLGPVSAYINALENKAGLPEPQNSTERVVQTASSAMAGVPSSLGIAKAVPQLAATIAPNATAGTTAAIASPVANAVSRTLQTAPGMQLFGAAGGGAGSSGAKEAGLGPGWQFGLGLLGGAAGVGSGSLLTAGTRGLIKALGSAETIPPQAAASRAETGVNQALRELGPQAQQSYQTPQPQPQPVPVQNPTMVGPPAPPAPSPVRGAPTTFQPIKQQVAQVIEQNPSVDPAAAMRAQDFRNLGMHPTLGQITRDPNQYAQELNMRGAPGVGSPLATRFNQQNTQLQTALHGLAGNATDAYQAGSAIKNSLQSIDKDLSTQVSGAYQAARASSGKNLDVPLTGIAQDYAKALKNFGNKVPEGVQNNFNELGLIGGTQRKTFSIEDAENLLKVINDNRSNDPSTNLALDTLNRSVKSAILSADDQGGVFAPARQLAAQRFALHDQIPALEAAASNSINPDDFVRRFIVGGKTDQVAPLAALLKQQAPDAFQEARNQIGAQLALKGFGQNVAGDAPFKPTGFAEQMQAFGPQKLGAFYSPDEINQLNTIGRVGSYMNAFPSSAPVNTSNTASALASIVGAGVKKIPYVGGLIENAQNRAFVNSALAASLKNAKSPSVPVDPRLLADALSKFTPPAK
jgi:hypothetical protein